MLENRASLTNDGLRLTAYCLHGEDALKSNIHNLPKPDCQLSTVNCQLENTLSPSNRVTA